MFSRSQSTTCAAIVVLVVELAAAQGGGPAPTGQAATLQLFAEKLKLNEKTQIPAVETIFTEAAKTAAPVGQEMSRARRQWIDAELAGKADEVAAARTAHTAAAAKMAAIEAQAYQRVFAFLKPNQQEKTSQAFPLMAGLFQPAAPRPSRPPRGGGGDAVRFEVGPVGAQRGGGSRGGGGGGGGFGSFVPPTRLATLTAAFKLDKAQTSSVKTLLDTRSKAAPPPTGLTAAYAAIGAAIQAQKTPEEIDRDVQAYAAASTAMTAFEITVLAEVLRSLPEAQRADSAAIGSAVFVMRGCFLDKKWDVVPGAKTY